jgi:error-prone DNA polymerase
MGARLLLVRGRIQRHQDIIHVVANRIEDRTGWLRHLSEDFTTFVNPYAPADEVRRPGHDRREVPRHPRTVNPLPKSRDFH